MKHLLRTRLKQIRAKITAEHSIYAKNRIKKRFFDFIKKNQYTCIAGYYPIKDELDILPILSTAENQGITIALPALNDKKDILIFKKWGTQDKLKKNKLFYEPIANAKVVIPDLIIIPLLGFDRNGHRLGYGSGHYDRTLPKYKNSLKIALAYSNQEVELIPAEKHDQKLDYIITEKEIIKVNGQH